MDWLRAQPIHFELSEPNLKILNVRNLTDTTVIGRCITVLHLASVEFCQGMTDFIRQQNCNYEEEIEGGLDDLK